MYCIQNKWQRFCEDENHLLSMYGNVLIVTRQENEEKRHIVMVNFRGYKQS